MGLAADFILIVVAGLLGGLAARALRLPLLVGYVVAGIFVGPHTAGPTVVQIRDIETLAEIGVALLLFSLGLEVSFRDLAPVRRVALLGGPLQLALTIGAGALAGVQWLRFAAVEALWFGAMISVSSTMVVLKVLAASGTTATLASRVMIGLLLVQDLAVIPLLIVLPQLDDPHGLAPRIAMALAQAAGVLVAVYLVGTRLLPPLFRRILIWGSRELFLVAVVATGVGIGAAVHAAGFSFALGAFVAGLVLSESEFSHQALSDLVPLRDIFGLLFFVTVGMLFEPRYVGEHWGLVVLVVAAILLGKALIFGVVVRSFGYGYAAPWIVGLGLCQIGEFSFVLARTGLQGGFVSKALYDLALTATVLTMAVAPVVSAAALPLGRAWQQRFGAPVSRVPVAPTVPSAADHVIVCGYGRTGRAVARALREAEIPLLIVEVNYALLEELRRDGHQGLWGDATHDEVLHAAHVGEARLVILTMPAPHAVDLAIARCRERNPGLALIARCGHGGQLERLRESRVTALQLEWEGGLEMARLGLLHCGRPDRVVEAIVTRVRRELYESG